MSARPREGGDPGFKSGFPLEFTLGLRKAQIRVRE
ncbi:hypothetical protein DFP91_3660 [Pseudorhodoplanes sinuspersici]|nr:hypothetical protein DFP91_3660 [Pseudorhodoplanes sinuspersici]